MSNDHSRQEKLLKKDQHATRDVRQEIDEEIRPSGAKPLLRQPNRDQARGDWDRTGAHQDVEISRSPDDSDEPADER